MKKYLLKLTAFCMTAVILLFVNGCASSTDDARERLLTVWSDYLRVQDEMYASELWALDYVERYLDTGDWNDLAKARTACIVSSRFLSELSMTEEDISDEEYLILAKTGMDVTYQSAEFESVFADVENEHTFVRNRILETLEGGVFLSVDIGFLERAVNLRKEYISYMCQCECISTNYLLLSYGDEENISAYWDELPEKYPALCAGRQEWNDSEAALEKNMDLCLDAIDDAMAEQADLLSAMGADLYKMTKVIESGDENAVKEWTDQAFLMENTPKLLPMPEWYSSETAKYLSFVTEKDGTILYPETGDALQDASYGVYMEIPDISADEIHDYADEVQAFAEAVWKSEEMDEWNIKMPDYTVQITVEGGTATVLFDGADVTFVPVWYLEAGAE